MIATSQYFFKFGPWWIRPAGPRAGCLAIVANVDTGRIVTIDRLPRSRGDLAAMLGLPAGSAEVTA
jgi:hypothetical protein